MKFWANSVVSFRGEVLSLGLFLQSVVQYHLSATVAGESLGNCSFVLQLDAYALISLLTLQIWVLSLSPGNALIVIGFLMFVTKYLSHKMQIFVHSHNSIPYYVLYYAHCHLLLASWTEDSLRQRDT